MTQTTKQRFVYAIIFLIAVIAFLAIRIQALEQQIAAAAFQRDSMQGQLDNMSTNYAKEAIHRSEGAVEIARLRHDNKIMEQKLMQNAPALGRVSAKHAVELPPLVQ